MSRCCALERCLLIACCIRSIRNYCYWWSVHLSARVHRDDCFTGHGATHRWSTGKLSPHRTLYFATNTFVESLHYSSARGGPNAQLCTATLWSHRSVSTTTTTATRHVCFTACHLECAASSDVQYVAVRVRVAQRLPANTELRCVLQRLS